MFQVDEEISFRMSQAVDSPQKQDSMSQMEKTNSPSISLSQSLFSQQNTPVSRSAADKEENFKDRSIEYCTMLSPLIVKLLY